MTYTSQQITDNSYQYTFTLNNTGTTDIGTLWVGWIAGSPGITQPSNLLLNNPNAGAAPGWTGFSVHNGTGGFSVEWFDTDTPLPPGQSLTGFTMTTADSPTYLAGPSFLGPTVPVRSSWIFIGPSQDGTDTSDPGSSLLAATVPETTTAFLLSAMIFLRRR